MPFCIFAYYERDHHAECGKGNAKRLEIKTSSKALLRENAKINQSFFGHEKARDLLRPNRGLFLLFR
jgi:hypothetical protein